MDAGGGSFLVERHDRDADPAERELLAELGFSGVLGVATSDPDGVWLIEVYADGDTFDLRSADLKLQLLSRAATGGSAAAADRMRQLRKRTCALELTAALGSRLAGMTDEQEIVEAAVEELCGEFDAFCAIVRMTASNEIVLAAVSDEEGVRLKEGGWRQPASLGLIGRALREREVVLSGDVRAEPDYRDTWETGDVRAELCAPLWAGNRLWGAINVESRHRDAFDADDAQLVGIVADQVSAALRSARLLDGLKKA